MIDVTVQPNYQPTPSAWMSQDTAGLGAMTDDAANQGWPQATMGAPSDDMRRHRSRWMDAREYREPWTREVLKDRKTLTGDVFNSFEKELFRLQERDVPNYNLAHQTIQIVAGIEAQNRSDLKFLPMGPDDIDAASAMTQLMKKVAGSNNLDHQTSLQFYDAATVGVGFLEVRKNTDPMGEPVYMGHVPTLDVWMDPAGRRMDIEDHSDIFIAKYLRPVQLARLFPKFGDEIMSLRGEDMSMLELSYTADYTNQHGDYPNVSNEDVWGGGRLDDFNRQGRARVLQAVERWYRVDEWTSFVKFQDGRVIEIPKDQTTPEAQRLLRKMAEALADGTAMRLDGSVKRIRYAVFCEELLLGDFASPYSHNRFPIVPMWSYQDDNGRPMGIARLLRSPMKDFNARMANMLKRALTRQTYAETGAFEDEDQAVEEMAMADGLIKLKPGGLKRLMFKDDLNATPVEKGLLEVDLKMITDLSGVTQSLMGQQSQEISGVAINAKINQGQTGLFTLFDQRNFTMKRVGEIGMSVIQDEYTAPMAIRNNESNKGIEFLFINKQDPTTGLVLNNVAQAGFDVAVSDVPASASDRMAKFQALTTFLAPMPVEVKMVFAAKLALLADIPDAIDVASELDQLRQRMLGGAPAGPDGGPVAQPGQPQQATGPAAGGPPGVAPAQPSQPQPAAAGQPAA